MALAVLGDRSGADRVLGYVQRTESRPAPDPALGYGWVGHSKFPPGVSPSGVRAAAPSARTLARRDFKLPAIPVLPHSRPLPLGKHNRVS